VCDLERWRWSRLEIFEWINQAGERRDGCCVCAGERASDPRERGLILLTHVG
jgi:hypothetical protein